MLPERKKCCVNRDTSEIDESKSIDKTCLANRLPCMRQAVFLLCRVGSTGTASVLKTDIPQGRYVPMARVLEKKWSFVEE